MKNNIFQLKYFNFNIILIFSFLVLLLISCEQKQPEKTTMQQQSPKKITTQFPLFSGKNAYDYLLKQTNFGPRNPNSAGHQQCLRFLESELKKYADKVTLQHFTHQGYNETLRLTNVFAQFKPELQQRILLLAHWDTRPRAELDADPKKQNLPIVGANDGASGVAVLLEMARIFKNNPPPIKIMSRPEIAIPPKLNSGSVRRMTHDSDRIPPSTCSAWTMMRKNIAPNSASSENTLNTLKYADRVKELKKAKEASM